jgi:hypothetical protein
MKDARTLLLIDAALGGAWSGLLAGGAWRGLVHVPGPAERAVPDAVRACLDAAGAAWGTWDGILFDEGPGSLLGIRASAAAVRAWLTLPASRAVTLHAFRSLELAAAGLLEHGRDAHRLLLLPNGRRAWFSLRIRDGACGGPVRAERPPPAEGATILVPSGVPVWGLLPEGAVTFPYSPEPLARHLHLARPVAEVDAWLPEPPTYRLAEASRP